MSKLSCVLVNLTQNANPDDKNHMISQPSRKENTKT